MTDQTIRYPLVDGESSGVLRELRQQDPVARVTLWNGKQAWLVTRYEDALRALTDPRLSTDATDPNFPSMNPSQVFPDYRGGLARMDEDRHRVMRGLVANKFTVRAVRRWRPISERIVAEQLAALRCSEPPADLIAEFALPVPLRMICRVLGVADADVSYVRHHAQMIITRSHESSRPSLDELRAFVDDLVERCEASPREGLIGQLATELLPREAMTRQDLSDLCLVLLVAGHTTTASTIGLSVLSLLEDPARYRALHQDPGLIAPLVEELLRFQSIVADGGPRVAKRDLVLGGAHIRAGDAVIISFHSANWDDEVFTGPDALQLDRARVRRHIAFGWGPHRCLGQHLARMEVRVALAGLVRTIPTLRLAVPVEELGYGYREKHLKHVPRLPVAW